MRALVICNVARQDVEDVDLYTGTEGNRHTGVRGVLVAVQQNRKGLVKRKEKVEQGEVKGETGR